MRPARTARPRARPARAMRIVRRPVANGARMAVATNALEKTAPEKIGQETTVRGIAMAIATTVARSGREMIVPEMIVPEMIVPEMIVQEMIVPEMIARGRTVFATTARET